MTSDPTPEPDPGPYSGWVKRPRYDRRQPAPRWEKVVSGTEEDCWRAVLREQDRHLDVGVLPVGRDPNEKGVRP